MRTAAPAGAGAWNGAPLGAGRWTRIRQRTRWEQEHQVGTGNRTVHPRKRENRWQPRDLGPARLFLLNSDDIYWKPNGPAKASPSFLTNNHTMSLGLGQLHVQSSSSGSLIGRLVRQLGF